MLLIDSIYLNALFLRSLLILGIGFGGWAMVCYMFDKAWRDMQLS
jgi:hypothetical protein